MRDGRARAAAALLVLTLGVGAGAPAARTHDRVYALVAARDLNPGVTITADDLVAVAIDADLLPDGVMIAPEQVIGRRPHERVLANELVRAERIADPESGVGLNTVLFREMRAISVEIADGAALPGFLEAGDHVDLLVTIDPESNGGGGTDPTDPRTHTVLQGVVALDTARATGLDDPAHTLVLSVDAQQAEAVAHAERIGEVRAMLRCELDDSCPSTGGRVRPSTRRMRSAGVPGRDPPGSSLILLSGGCKVETPVVP